MHINRMEIEKDYLSQMMMERTHVDSLTCTLRTVEEVILFCRRCSYSDIDKFIINARGMFTEEDIRLGIKDYTIDIKEIIIK